MSNTLEYLLSNVKQKIEARSQQPGFSNFKDDYVLFLTLLQELSKELQEGKEISQK